MEHLLISLGVIIAMCFKFKPKLYLLIMKLFQFTKRFLLLTLFFQFHFCVNPELNNPCDPSNKDFTLTLALRWLIDDKSNFCGYKVERPICDLPYSQVSLPENWRRLQIYYQTVARESKKTIQQIYTIPLSNSLSPVGFYSSGLLPNGKILAMPANPSDKILILDPSDDSMRTLTMPEALALRGYILGPNGKAYGIPSPGGKMLVYDSASDEITIKLAPSGTANFQGGVVVGQEIYMMNRTGENVLVYNIELDAFSLIPVGPNFTSSAVQYVGAALAPDGRIFAAPANQTNVLTINPGLKQARIDTIPQVNPNNSIRYFEGAVLGMDGAIYMFPRETTNILRVSPEDNTFRLLNNPNQPLTNAGGKYINGKLTPSGLIISSPYVSIDNDRLLFVNSLNQEVSLGQSIVPEVTDQIGNWIGATLARNGKIYYFPIVPNRPILVVDLGETFCDSVLLSAYMNNN